MWQSAGSRHCTCQGQREGRAQGIAKCFHREIEHTTPQRQGAHNGAGNWARAAAQWRSNNHADCTSCTMGIRLLLSHIPEVLRNKIDVTKRCSQHRNSLLMTWNLGPPPHHGLRILDSGDALQHIANRGPLSTTIPDFRLSTMDFDPSACP